MSAVRLNATARYLGVLVGPAAGGFILLGLGPSYGIFLNTIFYLPLLLWLVTAPYGPAFAPQGRRRGEPCAAWPTSPTRCAQFATIPSLHR
jgi:O-antigen/teichoic acid export membrane protein